MDHMNVDTDKVSRPSPLNVDEFLPWACTQMSVEADIIIQRLVLRDYVSAATSDRSKSKAKQKSRPPSPSFVVESHSNISLDKTARAFAKAITAPGRTIFIQTIYDLNLNLVKLKFLKNKTSIPRQVMKIIGFILPFHPLLSSITINSGLRMEAIHELSKLLPLSGITELCLDGVFVSQANYHILLEESILKHLSLSRCKIDDNVVKNIAAKLVFPLAASKKLSVLNLSSNRITDLGVKYIADALRSNRNLSYLNLADNMITDKGATSIFNSLEEFILTDSEITGKKFRYIAYLKEKTELMRKAIKDLRAGDFDRKASKRRSLKPVVGVKKDKDLPADHTKSLPNLDASHYERAEVIAEGVIGSFNDPFGAENSQLRDGLVYCYGNNGLCYLNLAYNDLSYNSLKKLYEVLLTQRLLCRRPRGLINVIIDGNFLPVACTELQQINDLLELGLCSFRRSTSVHKKKPPNSRSSQK